jgi:hypothetical protein
MCIDGQFVMCCGTKICLEFSSSLWIGKDNTNVKPNFPKISIFSLNLVPSQFATLTNDQCVVRDKTMKIGSQLQAETAEVGKLNFPGKINK